MSALGFFAGDSSTPIRWQANARGNFFVSGTSKSNALESANLDSNGSPNLFLSMEDSVLDGNVNGVGIEKLTERLWRVEGAVPGMSLKRTMTIAKCADGGLCIHSAIALDEGGMREIEAWGTPRHLVVPGVYHRLDAPGYMPGTGDREGAMLVRGADGVSVTRPVRPCAWPPPSSDPTAAWPPRAG
jgi:hypothetical protein